MSGKRAAFAVAAKNARRNKKRTFYLVLLIGLPVTVAVMTAAVMRASSVPFEEQVSSEYGAANLKIQGFAFSGATEGWVRDLVTEVDSAAVSLPYRINYQRFIDRSFGQVMDLDLDSPISKGILDLIDGREATAGDEIVLTEYLADLYEAGVGDHVSIALVGDEPGSYEVVGIARHPYSWNHVAAVVAPETMDAIEERIPGGLEVTLLVATSDDVALADSINQGWEQVKYDFYPTDRQRPAPTDLAFLGDDWYANLSDAEIDEVREVLASEGEDAAWMLASERAQDGWSPLPQVWAESKTIRISWAYSDLSQKPAVIGTMVAAIILAEVAFIAGAAFATGTRRRLREIGLLGANGAAHEQVRWTVVGEGLVAGLLGGLLGSMLAAALLLLGRPVVQRFVDRRIEDFPLSLVDVAGPLLVAIVACVLAAWLPAKTASRVPTLTALQGRMPSDPPKKWTVPAGIVTAGLGTLLFAVGLTANNSSGGSMAAVVSVIGAVLMIGGAALLGGPLVAWLSRYAERMPVTARIVLRDSGRHRSRAAAAVAATMVIMLIPVVALAALANGAAEQRTYGLEPREPQIILEGRQDEFGNTIPYEQSDLDLARASLPDATIAEFTVFDVPVSYPAEWEATNAGGLAEFQGGYYVSPFRVAVAGDQLLTLLDDDRIEAALAASGMVLIGVEERDTEIGLDGVGVKIAEVPVGVTRNFPRVLVTEQTAAGFGEYPAGTEALITTPAGLFDGFVSPFTPLWYAESNLQLSGGGDSFSPVVLLGMAFLATLLVVLIVVATITALSAAEAQSDLEVIVAVGAKNSIRRRFLGLQSLIHTAFGALLAAPLALILVKTAITSGGSYRSLGNFAIWDSSTLVVPWGSMAALLVGMPLAVGLITALTVRSAPLTPPRRAT